MIVKTIPSTWLIEEEHRLDCGPFVKGSMEARKILEHLNCKKDLLVEVTKDGIGGMYHVGQDKIMRASDTEHGMPFLRSADIMRADLSYQLLISRKQVSGNPLFACPEGATLITRSGTIGRMIYAREDYSNVAISQDVLKVVPDTKKIPSGYLYAFLISKYGVPIVTGGTFGSIITHIEAENIADLPIPRISAIEEKVHKQIQESAKLLTKYQAALNQATELYFDSVGLKDITPTEWHSWGSDLGFTAKAGVKSLRALNFNPRYIRLCERIKQAPWKSLGELCVTGTLQRGSRFNRIDAHPDYAYKLVGQKELFWLRPEGRWIAKKFVPDDVLVDEGSILVAARGTLGESELYCRATYIHGKLTENAYSEDILRVIGDENLIERGALFAFIRSESAFRMLRSISVGSKLQDHHYAMLPSLPVPYPSSDVTKRCHDLVITAYEAREEAIELEDQARALVERTIEEGGR
ncbi:type I restriction enzyme, S subunit [Syntrophus gentianae]|uniref:Type I restriction enzyme, S subunit n=1 Tax=Syntrophus gentianae TaxID=43775 RepID=A0A1H8AK64_9BACT|nr:restriction endonuclease subunit S [Syntrophus gentianae]SEM71011.1 type I restriction enzyme, S subunit [Syntrophus gentianae]